MGEHKKESCSYSEILKTPLYRILFNFPIGVIAFVILNYIFNKAAEPHNAVELSLQMPILSHNSRPDYLKDIYWLIYITLAILTGEVMSFFWRNAG